MTAVYALTTDVISCSELYNNVKMKLCTWACMVIQLAIRHRTHLLFLMKRPNHRSYNLGSHNITENWKITPDSWVLATSWSKIFHLHSQLELLRLREKYGNEVFVPLEFQNGLMTRQGKNCLRFAYLFCKSWVQGVRVHKPVPRVPSMHRVAACRGSIPVPISLNRSLRFGSGST
jgi:hypothetical protein